MSEKKTVARWATPSGKWWVELYVNAEGVYTYDATNSCGSLGLLPEAEALREMERQINCGDFQTGKTPVQRVALVVSEDPIETSAAAPQSGYTPCACRDCMDTTVSSDTAKPELCSECAEAGCDSWSSREGLSAFECQRDDAYGEC